VKLGKKKWADCNFPRKTRRQPVRGQLELGRKKALFFALKEKAEGGEPPYPTEMTQQRPIQKKGGGFIGNRVIYLKEKGECQGSKSGLSQ